MGCSFKRKKSIKNIFAKGYVPNWSEEVFVIKKVKNTGLWTYIINNVNSKEIFGTFYKKEFCKNQIKRISELKKQSREKVMNYMLYGKTMIILW